MKLAFSYLGYAVDNIIFDVVDIVYFFTFDIMWE